MTVAELSNFPPDAVVVLSKDAEGNGYSPLAGGEVGVYFPENTWSGEFSTTRGEVGEGDEDVDDEDEDEDEGQEGVASVALWPVN